MAKYIDNTNLGYLISKIKAAFWPKTDVTNVTLADVAVTGDYDDLINKPSGGDCNVFPVTIAYVGLGEYTISESIDDIEDAIDAGKTVVASYDNNGGIEIQLTLADRNYYYEDYNDNGYTGLLFTNVMTTPNPDGVTAAIDVVAYVLYNDGADDKVASVSSYIDTSTLESTGNKVTSLSSSSTDTQYPSAKCVYDELIEKANVITIGSSMPSGGFLPNVYYSLGTVSGSVTWSLASSSSAADEYMLEFTAASTAPTITWPTGIPWLAGSAPTINSNKTYQVSIQNNLAVCGEF